MYKQTQMACTTCTLADGKCRPVACGETPIMEVSNMYIQDEAKDYIQFLVGAAKRWREELREEEERERRKKYDETASTMRNEEEAQMVPFAGDVREEAMRLYASAMQYVIRRSASDSDPEPEQFLQISPHDDEWYTWLTSTSARGEAEEGTQFVLFRLEGSTDQEIRASTTRVVRALNDAARPVKTKMELARRTRAFTQEVYDWSKVAVQIGGVLAGAAGGAVHGAAMAGLSRARDYVQPTPAPAPVRPSHSPPKARPGQSDW